MGGRFLHDHHRPEVGYCVHVESMCPYAEDDQDEPEKMIEINSAYFNDNAPVLREQMARRE